MPQTKSALSALLRSRGPCKPSTAAVPRCHLAQGFRAKYEQYPSLHILNTLPCFQFGTVNANVLRSYSPEGILTAAGNAAVLPYLRQG
jgi:hypothetical protein